METGKQNDYYWLTSDSSLGVLLELCPEIVLGRLVAVVAFDSGPLKPTQDEKKRGWREDGNVAWSPVVTSVDILPHDGYDEWYIFVAFIPFQPSELFVNLGGFGLRDPEYLLKDLDPTWDRSLIIENTERIRSIQERFWSQLALTRAESYLADGDELIFATRDSTLFAHTIKLLES
jgi:hypothetical protein